MATRVKAKLSILATMLFGTLLILPVGTVSVGACHPETVCECDDGYIGCLIQCGDPQTPECRASCESWYDYCIAHVCDYNCGAWP
jgi:hypothetical protein